MLTELFVGRAANRCKRTATWGTCAPWAPSFENSGENLGKCMTSWDSNKILQRSFENDSKTVFKWSSWLLSETVAARKHSLSESWHCRDESPGSLTSNQ